ncbi:endonuclease/exonuclease/phosphatase family protein [bacterium]|nr:endonuclease/exonuclease/phosphatase family protein [bacterium]
MQRNRFLWAALLAMTLSGCGLGPLGLMGDAGGTVTAQGADLAPAGKFTLATYNVENLFDGSNTVINPKTSPAKSHESKQSLANAMRELNADVVGLVEVESKATLRNFRDAYLADMGYKHIALVEGNDPRGIDVAVLSRFPITHVKSHKNTQFGVPGAPAPQQLSRDLLQVQITPGKGYAFTVFMTHLKAHAGGAQADAKRKAEAMEIRRILRDFEDQNPRANYAVMGDFNDQPNTETLKVFLDGRDRDPKLYDALSELGASAFTYHPIKYRGRIDYILLSQGIKQEYVANSAAILDTPDAQKASDHLPAKVTIDATRDR